VTRSAAFQAFVLIVSVSLLAGSGAAWAADRHSACGIHRHACANVIVVTRCCCGAHGLRANDLAGPASRIDDSSLTSAPATAAAVMVAPTAFIVARPHSPSRHPAAISDLSVLFGDLRL
jgi:hypothetical protein